MQAGQALVGTGEFARRRHCGAHLLRRHAEDLHVSFRHDFGVTESVIGETGRVRFLFLPRGDIYVAAFRRAQVRAVHPTFTAYNFRIPQRDLRTALRPNGDFQPSRDIFARVREIPASAHAAHIERRETFAHRDGRQRIGTKFSFGRIRTIRRDEFRSAHRVIGRKPIAFAPRVVHFSAVNAVFRHRAARHVP